MKIGVKTKRNRSRESSLWTSHLDKHSSSSLQAKLLESQTRKSRALLLRAPRIFSNADQKSVIINALGAPQSHYHSFVQGERYYNFFIIELNPAGWRWFESKGQSGCKKCKCQLLLRSDEIPLSENANVSHKGNSDLFWIQITFKEYSTVLPRKIQVRSVRILPPLL